MSEEPNTPTPITGASDGEEMVIRERFVLLEERIKAIAWMAIAAALGVLALVLVLAVNAWKERHQ